MKAIRVNRAIKAARLQPDEIREAALDYGGQVHRCLIVGETPTRYRVRPLPGAELHLPLRNGAVRIILGAGTVLVPKTAIRVKEAR